MVSEHHQHQRAEHQTDHHRERNVAGNPRLQQDTSTSHYSAAPQSICLPIIPRARLLQVLNLFTDSFGSRLGIDQPIGNSKLPTLRAEGVELTVDFLTEEIEGASDHTARR